MADAFSRQLGTAQGRIAPAGTSPLAGSAVMCLGFDGASRFEMLAPGDFVQVEQQATFTAGTKLFRIPVIVRAPASIPAGYKWCVRILLDDTLVVEHRIVAGDTTRRRDFAINVSKVAAGNHIITVRLVFLTDDDQQYVVASSFECGP